MRIEKNYPTRQRFSASVEASVKSEMYGLKETASSPAGEFVTSAEWSTLVMRLHKKSKTVNNLTEVFEVF